MSVRTFGMSAQLHQYLLSTGLRETDLQRRLRTETAEIPNQNMQISPEQGQFMALLIELLGARRCLEIGTFTGYSALCVAAALPPGGTLVCCDISREWTDIARRYWQAAGLADRIDLQLGPALDTLDTLRKAGEAGRFDFAFIDADKQNYPAYYERCLELLRPGGVVALDNALWSGRVADQHDNDPDTVALRDLNRTIHADQRVTMSLVPIGDGLLLARKR